MAKAPEPRQTKTGKASVKKTAGGDLKSQPASIQGEGKVQSKEDLANLEEIESRLQGILESDSENGHEKICLFAARSVLRIFPLTIEYIGRAKPGRIRIFYEWRANMSAWFYTPDLTDFDVNLSDYNVAIISALSSSISNNNIAADSATIAAHNAIKLCGDDAARTSAMLDIEYLESPDHTPAGLRRTSLWTNQSMPHEIEKIDWDSKIDNLITEADDDSGKKVLQKIKHDYQAILKGAWHDDPPPDTDQSFTKDTAVEKPENDNPSIKDFLGRDKLVKVLEPRLSVPDDANHLTIGLLGNWGIGKSSVIEQLQKRLDKNNSHTEYLYGNFNAWSYEKTQNLQAGITHEMISALTTARKEWPWYQRWIYKPLVIGEFAARLHGWRIVAILIMLMLLVISSQISIQSELFGFGEIEKLIRSGLFGAGSIAILIAIWKILKTISAEPLAKELKTYLRLPRYQEHLGTIPVMEKQIKTLCEICLNRLWSHNQRRLIFFIDDLDRCGVDGIVQTFEAVRLVLGIRWVTVVIAMDQRIALPALACHYKQLSEFHQNDPMSIARDYLGKVIHLPVSLPPPDDLGVAQYLAYIWKDPAFFSDRIPKQEPEIEIEPVDHRDETSESKSDTEKPRESLQDIINDIDKMDVRAALLPEKQPAVTPPEGVSIETLQQLSVDQKIAFYDWLLKLNLRNPRQVKRLYNSYNLLWSHYSKDWPADEHRHPYLVALFVLEMINEYVVYNETQDTKAMIRQAFFSLKESIEMPEIADVSYDNLSAARKIIYDYQSSQNVSLLPRIEPFVLPASSPQDQ